MFSLSFVAALTALGVSGRAVPGFNVESVEYKNISFTVWDVGGQDKVRVRTRGAWRF
jgi:GTPase SAR1 family protein